MGGEVIMNTKKTKTLEMCKFNTQDCVCTYINMLHP